MENPGSGEIFQSLTKNQEYIKTPEQEPAWRRFRKENKRSGVLAGVVLPGNRT